MEKKRYNHLELRPRIARKKKRTVSRLPLALILLSIILGSAVFLSRQDKFLIGKIVISGNETLSSDLIRDTLNQKLTGYYLGLIPKNNILLYPRKELEKDLRENFKRLSAAQVRLDRGYNLTVILKEREPAYLSCQSVPEETKTCYLMDAEGFPFEKAPELSGQLYFEFYGSPLGSIDFKRVLSAKDSVVQILKKNGFDSKPISLEILEAGDYDLKFENWRLLFNKEQKEETLSRNLELALNAESFKEKITDKDSVLDYIDLRFNKKVYYKFSSS